MDQLMNFAWKFMLPLSLINIVAAASWKFVLFPFNWLVSAAIILTGYFALGFGLMKTANYKKRTYKFAT